MAQSLNPQEPDERTQTLERYQAIFDALAHARSSKGVLDTSPYTRDLVKRAEAYAHSLEKEIAPLEKQMRAWRNEATAVPGSRPL